MDDSIHRRFAIRRMDRFNTNELVALLKAHQSRDTVRLQPIDDPTPARRIEIRRQRAQWCLIVVIGIAAVASKVARWSRVAPMKSESQTTPDK